MTINTKQVYIILTVTVLPGQLLEIGWSYHPICLHNQGQTSAPQWLKPPITLVMRWSIWWIRMCNSTCWHSSVRDAEWPTATTNHGLYNRSMQPLRWTLHKLMLAAGYSHTALKPSEPGEWISWIHSVLVSHMKTFNKSTNINSNQKKKQTNAKHVFFRRKISLTIKLTT